MTLTLEQLGDLVTTTQKNLGRMHFNDIGTTLTDFEVLPRLLKSEKQEYDSGIGIQWNLMVKNSGAAKHTGVFGVDNVNVGDVMKTATVPFRHSTTNYAFDRLEQKVNSGAAAIVDLVKVRRIDAMLSLAELLEEAFWSKPATSADVITPFGVDYWFVYNATEGFNGGNPTGFSDGCGGLSSVTYPTWRNYTANYTSVSKADLVTKMRKAYRLTDFKSPVDIPDYRTGRGQVFVNYCNEATMAEFENLGEAQNENLGRDLAPMDGSMTFRKCPIRYIPQLDEDTNNPVFGLNWNTVEIATLKGEMLREDAPSKAPNQHTVLQCFVDLTWNMVCRNRRRNFLISKGTRPSAA
jgi:hypothetical protein